MIGKGFVLAAALAATPIPAPVAAARRDWPLPPERPAEAPFRPPADAAPASPPAKPLVADPAPSKPDDACLARLKALGAEAEAVPAPPAPLADCSVDQPVTLTAIALASGDRLMLPARPLLACAFAETFATFARDLAGPLGAATLGVRIAAIDTGPGYDCRPRNHIVGARTSAHGRGIAIDVTGFETADKRRVAIERQDDARDAAYVRTLRTAACGWFLTVLGPGADAAHASHLHLDGLRHDASGAYRICE